MYRAYRIYRNMTEFGDQPKDTHQICIEFIRVPNLWVLFLLELEESADGVCGLLHDVPLPKWLTEFESEWDCDCGPDEECKCSSKFGDYYGDDLGSFWHCFIEMPISDYIFKRTREGTLHVNVPLDKQWDGWDEVKWVIGDIEREKVAREWHWTDYPGEGKIFKFVEWVTRPFRPKQISGGVTGSTEPTWETPKTEDGTVVWTNVDRPEDKQ